MAQYQSCWTTVIDFSCYMAMLHVGFEGCDLAVAPHGLCAGDAAVGGPFLLWVKAQY
jgi:hypothetical protein